MRDDRNSSHDGTGGELPLCCLHLCHEVHDAWCVSCGRPRGRLALHQDEYAAAVSASTDTHVAIPLINRGAGPAIIHSVDVQGAEPDLVEVRWPARVPVPLLTADNPPTLDLIFKAKRVASDPRPRELRVQVHWAGDLRRRSGASLCDHSRVARLEFRMRAVPVGVEPLLPQVDLRVVDANLDVSGVYLRSVVGRPLAVEIVPDSPAHAAVEVIGSASVQVDTEFTEIPMQALPHRALHTADGPVRTSFTVAARPEDSDLAPVEAGRVDVVFRPLVESRPVEEPLLALDFGTVQSKAAVLVGGRARAVVFPPDVGSEVNSYVTVPTALHRTREHDWVIGELAQRMMWEDPGGAVRSADSDRADLPLKSMLLSGITAVEVRGEALPLEEVIGAYLWRLFCRASETPQFQESCGDVTQPGQVRLVLTVPAAFGEAHRAVLARAAERAGFDLERTTFVTEPEAAASLFARSSLLGEGNVGVIDSGGGTTDVAALAITLEEDPGRRVWRAIYSPLGQPMGVIVGGTHFDRAVYGLVREEFEAALPGLLAVARRQLGDGHDEWVEMLIRTEMMNACRLAKERVASGRTDGDSMHVALARQIGDEQIRFESERAITREAIDAVIRPQLGQLEELWGRLVATLQRAEGFASRFDQVYLVGGSSLFPPLVESVRERFDTALVSEDVGPEDRLAAVARGAVHAIWSAEAHITQDHVGIEVGGRFEAILRRGVRYPTGSVAHRRFVIGAGVRHPRLRLMSAGDERGTDAMLLGEFRVPDEAARAARAFDVTIGVDAGGRLQPTVRVLGDDLADLGVAEPDERLKLVVQAYRAG